MNRAKIFLFSITLFLTLFGATVFSYAYVYNGQRWPDPAMGEPYLVNPNCTDPEVGSTQDIIDAMWAGARAWWNEGNANFSFQYGGYTGAVLPNDNGQGGPYNGANEIMFVQASQNYWYFVQYPSTIAVTWTWYNTQTNLIFENDMAFNDGGFIFSAVGNPKNSEMDVWNIAAHEFGHYLSLGHSDQFLATMYAGSSLGETKKRDLYSDDTAGIQYIYGVAPNTNPVLTNGRVSPTTGGLETIFSYFVNYADSNSGFSNARVRINGGEAYMTLYSGTPSNGTYKHDTTLPYLATEQYSFYAEDGQGGSDTLPVLGYYTGPTVVPVTLSLVNLTPIVPLGGTLRYDATVVNQNTSNGYSLKAEGNVRLPNGQMYGPVLGPINFSVSAGQTILYHGSQFVPPTAPLGDYTYIIDISYQGSIIATDSFPFTVTATGAMAGSSSTWSGSLEE